MKRNPFVELNAIDVSDHIEEKNGLKYLSWAWAETEIKKRFPMTTFETLENPDAVPIPHRIKIYEGTEFVESYGKKKEVSKPVGYETVMILDRRLWPTVIGATVKTRVTIKWEEDDKLYTITTEDQLPVMTPTNKAIPIEDIDAMSLNKTIQRSLTKAIAMQGLGMYIYAGEDIPEIPDDVLQNIADVKMQIEACCGLMKGMDAEKKKPILERFKELVGDGRGNYKACNDLNRLNAVLSYITEATKEVKGE